MNSLSRQSFKINHQSIYQRVLTTLSNSEVLRLWLTNTHRIGIIVKSNRIRRAVDYYPRSVLVRVLSLFVIRLFI